MQNVSRLAVPALASWTKFIPRVAPPAAACAAVVLTVACARCPGLIPCLLAVPAGELLALSLALGVGAVCLGQLAVHRRFAAKDFVAHNQVAGVIIAVVGTLYGVLLGFLTVVAWQHYADARQLVAREAAAAVDAWHVALGLPPGPRARVRADLLAYSQQMVAGEWPAMRSGGFDKPSEVVAMDSFGAAEGFNPASLVQANAQSATIAQLETLHDVRVRRLSDNDSGLSTFEWVILFVGAVCVVCFCWLFGVENARVHLLMTTAVTVVVTSTLVLLFELQFPFRSSVGIPANDWVAVIDHIHSMQSGPMPYMKM